MKIAMVNLPSEIKNLVNQGIYSLYELREKNHARYVLATDTSTTYFLDETGTILTEGGPLEEIEVVSSVSFEPSESTTSLSVNGF